MKFKINSLLYQHLNKCIFMFNALVQIEAVWVSIYKKSILNHRVLFLHCNSPELKSQLDYFDHFLSDVCLFVHLSVHFSHKFNFFSGIPGQTSFLIPLAKPSTKHNWAKGFLVC